jgi:DNA repair exonuclease SbcCD ATPase subunit
LSGGQRALLRLCWILSVSTLFNYSFLFLDETINSLDNEAIARVAVLLEEFIKKQQLHFFVVTHATQIQEMDFWQRIVQLES